MLGCKTAQSCHSGLSALGSEQRTNPRSPADCREVEPEHRVELQLGKSIAVFRFSFRVPKVWWQLHTFPSPELLKKVYTSL